VFYAAYVLSELRRRRGRTLLTALGLAVGVGLVVTVSALSAGLDRAQEEALEPLTGVGTDLSVTRPLELPEPGSSGAGPGGLSEEERAQLEEENGGARLGLRDLGEPGESFSTDRFVSGGQLSFPESEIAEVGGVDGVSAVAGGLTLNAVHVEGTVPEPSEQSQGGFVQPQAQGPESLDLTSISVTGVDESTPELGALTSGQLASGSWFSTAGAPRQAILNLSYANREGIAVGDSIKLGGKTFTVIGLAETPLGGQASDVYVKLATLQRLSDRKGRVNTVYARAASSDEVERIAASVERSFEGSSVTTAQELADRVSGSLVDAKNLAGRIGTALVVVGLLAAFLIATLLTLSSVAKRTRELGTLKALGWRQRLVVRQVTAESLVQGVLGGLLGVGLGLAGAALVSAFAPTLTATFAETASRGPGFAAAFGQGAVAAGSADVQLDAPVSLGLAGLAVALAVAGGLLAGAVGGLRAARLRPADALRHVD
jgi:putative ABC transport system permease protein